MFLKSDNLQTFKRVENEVKGKIISIDFTVDINI